VIRILPFVLIPVAIAALLATLIPEGARGFSAESVRLGCFLIAAWGLLSVLGSLAFRSIVCEWLGLLSIFSSAWVLSGHLMAALVVGVSVAGGWTLLLLLRSLRLSAAAPAVLLVLGAAAMASPYLLPPKAEELPNFLVTSNPLAQIHHGVMGEDWFHGPSLYRIVGEHYYRAPDPERFLWIAAGISFALLMLAAAIWSLLPQKPPLEGRSSDSQA
jgi:hypothetical protein